MGNNVVEENTQSEIDISDYTLNTEDYYDYIQIADDTYDSVNVVNQPSYIPYYMCIIFALGIIGGLLFGYISSWKE